MRLIVTGGRNFADAVGMARVFAHFAPTGPHLIVHGACKVMHPDGSPYLLRPGERPGADRLAHYLALAYGWRVEPHPVDWPRCADNCPSDHPYTRRDGAPYCPWAGPRRNQHMADLGADGLIALPGGKGTERMVKYARRAGIPVWEPLKA